MPQPARFVTTSLTALLVGAFVVFGQLRPLAQSAGPASATSSAWLDAYREPAARLIGESMASPFAWERLALMV
ncbi:MAG: hypothetical protein ABI211_14515, partial [Vicinamibacterales bacterium]